MSAPPSLRLYALATSAAFPAAALWLRSRVRRGKEDPDRWPERLGRAGGARPAGRLAWLHGVSVGESLSLLPLVERLRAERPEVVVLVTSGTRASAELLAARLPTGVLHQYAPVDAPVAVRRFLDHWRPDIGVLVESELWPNLILEARTRGVRLALVSAKLSDRSLRGWRRAPPAARALLDAFELLLARDEAAAARFAALGARIDGLADLKFGGSPLPVDAASLARAREAVGSRPVLLAASTHAGEDERLLAAFQAVAASPAQPLLVLVPRHPGRGEAVERLAREKGLAVGRRSRGDALGGAPVYVADTVGELGLWYRVARLAVIGGSLAGATASGVAVGGHNPLEAARLGCPFVSGPYVAGWPVYDALQEKGATRLVDPADLASWFSRALDDDPALADMAARARAFVATRDASAGAGVEQVLALLPPRPSTEDPGP